VLAPRRGGVQVVGQARRAGLGRRRVTKHNLALSGHDGLVGQDDQEIDDSYEDDEVDDRRDKASKVEEGGVAAALDELPPQPRAEIAGLNRGDQRVDDVVGERLDYAPSSGRQTRSAARRAGGERC
jgi:hypothetical protein